MAASLPYEAATAGDKAMVDIVKVLEGFGADDIGHMLSRERGELLVQFRYRGQPVQFRANFKGYAALWLKRHPMTSNHRCTRAEYEQRALSQAQVSIYSILRDQIKGAVTAVETGAMAFEAAFLGNLMLPNGRTILEHVEQQKLLASPATQE